MAVYYLAENLKSWQCDHWGFQVECVFRYWDLTLSSAHALEGEIWGSLEEAEKQGVPHRYAYFPGDGAENEERAQQVSLQSCAWDWVLNLENRKESEYFKLANLPCWSFPYGRLGSRVSKECLLEFGPGSRVSGEEGWRRRSVWLAEHWGKEEGGSQQVVYYRARDKTWGLIGFGGQDEEDKIHS